MSLGTELATREPPGPRTGQRVARVRDGAMRHREREHTAEGPDAGAAARRRRRRAWPGRGRALSLPAKTSPLWGQEVSYMKASLPDAAQGLATPAFCIRDASQDPDNAKVRKQL